MNRIILIGNGFDLAHGLRTSYADFIRNYWENWVYYLYRNNNNSITDGLSTFTLLNSRFRWTDIIHSLGRNKSKGETIQYIRNNKDVFKIEDTSLLAEINKAIETKGWLDIETEFYHLLKELVKGKEIPKYKDPNKLNDELKILKNKLIIYLDSIQTQSITPELKIESIQNAIYEPFRACDISINEYKRFNTFLRNRWENGDYRAEDKCKRLLLKYRLPQEGTGEIAQYVGNSDVDHHIYDIYHERTQNIHPYFLLPDDILFLNFNYTSTADLYIPEDSEFKVNHIHGELGNEKNPIIFGYGDELDDDYKEIAKLNDNDYLKNIKSIRYLETDNYRKLLSFIDSAPFQIYIMGHSCGNSDRTLLNTLFEHKNCVSIKPFYYEKPDGTDNYIEIVQNISRNFNDMRLMRDRVVNKTYCRALVPNERS